MLHRTWRHRGLEPSVVTSLATVFGYDVSPQAHEMWPTCGVEVRSALAQLVHVLQAALHQAVAVRVPAAIVVRDLQDLLVIEQTLALLFAQGAYLGCAVRGGCWYLLIQTQWGLGLWIVADKDTMRIGTVVIGWYRYDGGLGLWIFADTEKLGCGDSGYLLTQIQMAVGSVDTCWYRRTWVWRHWIHADIDTNGGWVCGYLLIETTECRCTGYLLIQTQMRFGVMYACWYKKTECGCGYLLIQIKMRVGAVDTWWNKQNCVCR
jgi:hypothetical protein